MYRKNIVYAGLGTILLQASPGGLPMYPSWIRGDYCVINLF